MRGAKAALREAGFTRNVNSNVNGGKRYGEVYGDHYDGSMTAEINCEISKGVTILGVAGLDNDVTFRKYNELHRAEW